MNYLHSEFDAGPDHDVMVTLSVPANVMMLDPVNFEFIATENYSDITGVMSPNPLSLSARVWPMAYCRRSGRSRWDCAGRVATD